jgi:hypothetical protein
MSMNQSHLTLFLKVGDFNSIRRQEEKNNDYFDSRWQTIFNAIIESLEFREIGLSRRQFTWASRRKTPTYEKLYRVLANIECEQKFMLVIVWALTRTGSDQTPMLVDASSPDHLGKGSHF